MTYSADCQWHPMHQCHPPHFHDPIVPGATGSPPADIRRSKTLFVAVGQCEVAQTSHSYTFGRESFEIPRVEKPLAGPFLESMICSSSELAVRRLNRPRIGSLTRQTARFCGTQCRGHHCFFFFNSSVIN